MSMAKAVYPAFIGSTLFGQPNQNFCDGIIASTTVSSSPISPTILPSASTVVIGKGRVPKTATGNHKLRALVLAKVPAYVNARSKMVKSSIVTDIYYFIEKACLKEGSSPPFLRYNKCGYTRSSESIAREKITATFRDCLCDRYKSSSKNKVAKRRLRNMKKAKHRQQNLSMAQRPKRGVLWNALLKIRQVGECALSFSPQSVQSRCNYGNSTNIRTTSSFEELYVAMQNLPRIGAFSKPLIEFDRSFDDFDLEPVPIAETVETSSTCSALASASGFAHFYV